ncbi:MAG: hypothetical protein ABSF03_28805 [Streptosporangiaceae bacterium]
MTAPIADRAAGVLQGAADAAQGVMHHARAWSTDHHPDEREAAARERWHAGQPARNTFERDAYATFENQARTGMNRLITQGRQASAMEAEMAAAAGPEAGQ